MFKRLFATETKEIKFGIELTILFSLLFLIGAPWLIIELLDLMEVTLLRVGVIIFDLALLYLLYLSIVRIDSISDNRHRLRAKQGLIKYKYSPQKYHYKDILLWYEKIDIPDKLYVLTESEERFILEVDFELDGRKEELDEKIMMIDDEEFNNIKDIEKKLFELGIIDNDNMITIESLSDNNDPKLFKNVLTYLDMKKYPKSYLEF